MWYTATWNRYAPTRFVLFRSHSLWKPSKSTQSILCIVLFIDCKLKNVISYRGNGKFTIHFIYCFLRAHKCVCVRCFFLFFSFSLSRRSFVIWKSNLVRWEMMMITLYHKCIACKYNYCMKNLESSKRIYQTKADK